MFTLSLFYSSYVCYHQRSQHNILRCFGAYTIPDAGEPFFLPSCFPLLLSVLFFLSQAPAAGVSATSPNTAAPLPVYEDRSSLWCSPNTPSPSSVKSQPTITPLTAAPAFHRGATFMMASTTSYATSSACSPYSSDTRHLPAYAPRDTQEKYVEASSFKPRLTQGAKNGYFDHTSCDVKTCFLLLRCCFFRCVKEIDI